MARAARGSNAAMAEPDFYMPPCYLYILSRAVIVLQPGLCVAFPRLASSFLFPEVGPISGTATTYLAISAPLANNPPLGRPGQPAPAVGQYIQNIPPLYII